MLFSLCCARDVTAASRFADLRVRTNDTREFNVTLPAAASASDLRITLAWADPPASPAAGRMLVNDLDLVALSPSGQAVLGNAFLQLNGANRKDDVNNVEKIVIANPAAGVWRIQVRGASVPVSAPQEYALVVNYGRSNRADYAGVELRQGWSGSSTYCTVW